MEYDNGTVMTLIPDLFSIYVFQIDPFIGLISNYQINLNDTLKSSQLEIESVVIKNNMFYILTIYG